MVRSLASLGFTFNQIQYAIDDARDIATLEMIARKAGN
jgi:hypothetical protein